ncbi:hypothetical protein H5410_017611 [Solanum commersonii]|uniref:Uncharacterized protein n=1 Tax=Solanum commersonii TaxID=4109 RepID=A0A9J6A0H2_SOLCO|nr:hypothetical protein H5410_017611 [Solanum commersonii]
MKSVVLVISVIVAFWCSCTSATTTPNQVLQVVRDTDGNILRSDNSTGKIGTNQTKGRETKCMEGAPLPLSQCCCQQLGRLEILKMKPPGFKLRKHFIKDTYIGIKSII